MDPLAKFATWFLLEIVGGWFIWASYMAIKFMIEDAQGQHAAFSLRDGPHAHAQVGAFIMVPIMVSVIWTIISAVIATTD